MAIEIERKFLVKGPFKQFAFKQSHIRQGYLSSGAEATVRIRIKGEKGYITIKGKSNEVGMSRFEWEKEIPLQEAEELIQLCNNGLIDKMRYEIRVGKHVFEVDEFFGENEGLIMAEVELNSETEDYIRPEWLGQEVTGDRRYYNSHLLSTPFSTWGKI
jgi:adenylate cyclase